jgi:hypothetical protein
MIYVTQECSKVLKYKNDLEYKISYYRQSLYRSSIEEQIKNLDYSMCEKYYKYKDLIH